jgi:hypothetical protein
MGRFQLVISFYLGINMNSDVLSFPVSMKYSLEPFERAIANQLQALQASLLTKTLYQAGMVNKRTMNPLPSYLFSLTIRPKDVIH